MSLLGRKILGVSVGVTVVAVLIALYVSTWATSMPREVTVAVPLGGAAAQLTLQTVGTSGTAVSPAHPDWVSYLVRQGGKWVHSTDFTLPANTVVQVTIYQYDSPTGLRNPFMSQVQGTIGGSAIIDGKPAVSIPATEASHTFAVPELGVFVPLPGIPEGGKSPCEAAPCEPSSDHRTISFSFRTGAPGHYRWQCFVPCGAGFIAGNGGAMQTLGYMDGFINVV